MKKLIIVVLGFFLSLGSVSCSSSSAICTGEVTSQGKTYTGSNKKGNKDQARLNACNKYCLETDPKCEALYGIWVTSPKGQAAGSPPKSKAIYEDQKLMDCVTITCANKCVADIKTGSLQGKVSCK